MKYFNILALCFSCAIGLAQVSTNFEFLDHDNKFSSIGASHVYDEGILYVSHNGTMPMTTLCFAREDNTKEIIFDSPFSSQSYKQILSDSSYIILIYGLFDYDIGVPGMYTIVERQGEVHIEEYFTETLDYRFYLENVRIDSIGDLYDLSGQELKKMRNDSLIETIELDDRYSLMHFNYKFDVFLSDKTNIKYFDGENTISIIDNIPSIYDIANLGEENLVLHEGKLAIYSSDFNQLLKEIEISEAIKTFKQMSIVDSIIYSVYKEGEEIFFVNYDFNSNEKVLKTTVAENEIPIGVNIKNKNDLILEATLKNDIGKNVFFRNVSLDTTNQYKHINFDISDYSIYQYDRDSTFSYISPLNDSIFFYNYYFEVDYRITNLDDEDIYALDVFGGDFFGFFGFSPFFNYRLNGEIKSNDNLDVDLDFKVSGYGINLSDYKLVVPGANYRFHGSGVNSALPEFTSDVKNVLVDPEITLYPNPSFESININSNKEFDSWAIYNSMGVLIKAGSFNAEYQIEISELTLGSYFLNLRRSNKASNWQKFTKL